VHDFMVDNGREQEAFATWYLLGSVLDNPHAVCLTPDYVELALSSAGFKVEGLKGCWVGVTMLTRALKPE